MLSETIPGLKNLSVEEKQQLIGELISEVYGAPVEEPELREAIEARLEHFRQNPDSAVTWEEMKARRFGEA